MNLQEFINENGPVRDIQLNPDKVLIRLENDIDMECSPEVRSLLLEVTGKKIPTIGIDLSGVPYMDSSGLATLVEAMQRVKKYNGRLVLFGLQQRVHSVFEIAKLTSIFTIQAQMSEGF